jgi:hypothetical protein
MYIDCILASPRIAQVDPGDGPLFEVVLSQAVLVAVDPASGGRRRGWFVALGSSSSLVQALVQSVSR